MSQLLPFALSYQPIALYMPPCCSEAALYRCCTVLRVFVLALHCTCYFVFCFCTAMPLRAFVPKSHSCSVSLKLSWHCFWQLNWLSNACQWPTMLVDDLPMLADYFHFISSIKISITKPNYWRTTSYQLIMQQITILVNIWCPKKEFYIWNIYTQNKKKYEYMENCTLLFTNC